MFTASFVSQMRWKYIYNTYRSNFFFFLLWQKRSENRQQNIEPAYFGIQFIVFILRCRLSGAIWVWLTLGVISPQVAYNSIPEKTGVKTFLLRKVGFNPTSLSWPYPEYLTPFFLDHLSIWKHSIWGARWLLPPTSTKETRHLTLHGHGQNGGPSGWAKGGNWEESSMPSCLTCLILELIIPWAKIYCL